MECKIGQRVSLVFTYFKPHCTNLNKGKIVGKDNEFWNIRFDGCNNTQHQQRGYCDGLKPTVHFNIIQEQEISVNNNMCSCNIIDLFNAGCPSARGLKCRARND